MLYCPNFFWNVLQVWMTGKDVYLQMTWSWPDKTWNILCSYCLQWNTSQSKFRNHYFLFLFAFSILSQLFLIWGCRTYFCQLGTRGSENFLVPCHCLTLFFIFNTYKPFATTDLILNTPFHALELKQSRKMNPCKTTLSLRREAPPKMSPNGVRANRSS